MMMMMIDDDDDDDDDDDHFPKFTFLGSFFTLGVPWFL